MRGQNTIRVDLQVAGAWLAVVLILGACTDAPKHDEIGVVRAAQTEALGGGTLPLPIVEGSDPPQLAWDGTYAELLAMDAWAVCSLTQQLGTDSDVFDQGEFFFSVLSARHGTAVGGDFTLCGDFDTVNVGQSPLEIILQEWLLDRQDPACNIHPITRLPAGVSIEYTTTNAFNSAYGLPNTTALSLSGSEKEAARDEAQKQVQYAFVNLCIARRLRDNLESVDVALASRDTLLEISRIARERALTAVFQMSEIAKAFGIPASESVQSITNPHQIVPVLVAWRNWLVANHQDKLTELGKDFALAISTLVDASLDHTQLVLRSPEAHKSLGSYRVVTGFDELNRRILAGPRVFTAIEGFGTFGEALPTAVAADMSAPEIGVLLGLARQADALDITASDSTINMATNAQALLDAAEEFVRQQDCDAEGNTSSTCADIPPGIAPEDYKVFQRFNVQLAHARTLVEALVEHIFGQPTDEAFQTTLDDWNFGTLRIPTSITKRLSGEHTYSGNFEAGSPGGTLHIDPDFNIRTSAGSLQDQTWAYLPPRTMRQDVHWLEQGFGFRSLWILRPDPIALPDPNLQVNLQLARPVGSVPVLAGAREALLTMDPSVASLFQAAAPGLSLLDQTIGKHSVLIRRKTIVEDASGQDNCNPLWSFGDPLQEPTTCKRLQPSNQMDGDAEYTLDVVTSTDDTTSLARRSLLPVTDGGCGMGACALNDLTSAESIALDSFVPSFVGNTHQILQGEFAVPTERGVNVGLVVGTDDERDVYRGVLDSPSNVMEVEDRAFVDRTSGERVDNTWRNEQFFFSIPPPPGGSIIQSRFVEAGPALNTNFGRATGNGGELGIELDRAQFIQRVDWSKPEYDALGLRMDFAPMGDASLYGGPHGDEAYRYFLQRAGEAANEATVAFQTAVDTLTAETEDRVRLSVEETRGREIAALEMRALCGNEGPCEIGKSPVALPTPPCRALGSANLCARMQLSVQLMTAGGGVLATPVAEQIGAAAPDFTEFSGGEIESLLIEQWNAWRQLELGVVGAIFAADAATDQQLAADAEAVAAQEDFDLVGAEVLAGWAAAIADDVSFQAQKVEYLANANEYASQLTLAGQNMTHFCDQELLDQATLNGFSYSGDDVTAGPYEECIHFASRIGGDDAEGQAERFADGIGGYVDGTCDSGLSFIIKCGNDEPCGIESQSWSAASGQAAQDRCDAATFEYNAALTTLQGTDQGLVSLPGIADAIAAQLQALDVKLLALGFQAEALTQRYVAALARRDASLAQVAAARSGAEAQTISELLAVQAAWGNLLETMASIERAQQQAALRVERVQLEADLVTTEVQARFALRRTFQSFDLWRARALSENARRLAVTARRAIEARFVVDLSELNSAEPFVEAPAVWADEIYDSDLKPPSSLGRTGTPTDDANAVYLNKLVDYVNNLELFVNGYSLQRPRASVQTDTEVLQLPAPAPATSLLTVDGSVYTTIDDRSLGWSFFCEDSGTWIPHPNANDFGIASFDLSTACNGSPPVLARLGLWLDPWGRPNRHIADEPFSERYNTRWRLLALNLVGSGIRDCSAVLDAAACYAEPFISYHLRHVGPAWVTSHEQNWRAIPVPTAVIEGGKALAAEEWVDPISNSFNTPHVANVAREEFAGRPLGGAYELTLELSPDVRVERIQRIQLLAQMEYWVRQETGDEFEVEDSLVTCGNGIIEPPETCEYGVDGGVSCVGDPAECDDGLACTTDTMSGSPLLCTSACVNTPITSCQLISDGCCPVGCNFNTDRDCGDAELCAGSPPECDCGDGFLECDGDQASCESLSSAEHCTACDVPCGPTYLHATADCSTGACELTCASSYDDCDSDNANGCETNIFTVENCGGCANLGLNQPCPARPNATNTCPAGTCQYACNAGYLDCNADMTDGCEIQGSSCWPASNFNPASYNFAGAPTTTLNCGTTTVNTTDPDGAGSGIVTFTNWCGTTPSAAVQTQAGGPDAVVLLLNGLTVSSGATLRLIGNRPIIVAVNGNVTVEGTVDANSTSTNAGAGANYNCTPATTNGAGSNGTGSSSFGGGGGGGGGFGTAGGNGGDGDSGANGVGGAVRGNATLLPLIGGCQAGNGGGFSGSNGIGGDGGGAVEISAAGTLTVAATGVVRAHGEPGTLGNGSEGGGGGGGSGGAVLLEAGALAISGAVTTNGGNGGNGSNGSAGAAGSTSSGSSGGTAANHGSNGGGGGGGGYGRAVQQDLLP